VTLSEIRTLITQFTNLDLASVEQESPTATQLTARVNEVVRRFAAYTLCCYHPKLTLTLSTGVDLYSLRSLSIVQKRIVKPYSVILNTLQLYRPDGVQPGFWSMTDFERACPGWRTYGNGTPTRAILLPNNQLLLSQPPDATAVAATNYINGHYLPNDLVNGADEANEPDIPAEFHMALAWMAADLYTYPNATENSMWVRLKAFRNDWGSDIERLKLESSNRLFGDSALRGYQNDFDPNRIFV
jgi:hypothetical protein